MPGHSPPPSTGTVTTPWAKTQPAIYFNWEDWMPYLDDMQASVDEKRQLIETLRTILECFGDQGCELVGPDDIAAQKTCGQVVDLKATLELAMLKSGEPTAHLTTYKEEV